VDMRRGMGRGTGRSGYYNLTYADPHIHSLSARGISTYSQVLLSASMVSQFNVSKYSTQNFIINNDNIFDSKDRWTGERPDVMRFMWHPETNDFILSGNRQHANLLHSHKVVEKKDVPKFDEWVRGIYSRKTNTIYLRPYFNRPDPYTEFNVRFEKQSVRSQERLLRKLVEQGVPKDSMVVFNTDNARLQEKEGSILW